MFSTDISWSPSAADDYVETLKKTNSAWEYQEEMVNRYCALLAAF
jgi:hypothetical protein